MSSEQGFRGIPGIPDGWELVRIVDEPKIGEYALACANRPVMVMEPEKWDLAVIVRKIEKPKRYRPFENAEEFKPFRDAWFVREGAMCQICRYDDDGIWIGGTYHFVSFKQCCRSLKFDDGTPFGVEVTE
ncbi:MAG: hypothetical protein ACK5S6_03425 [bacterium]